MSACSDNDSDHPIGGEVIEEKDVTANLQLQIQIGGGGALKSLKDGTLNGDNNPDENKITKLTFFVIDLDQNGDLNWNKVRHASIAAPASLQTGTALSENITVRIRTSVGKKHIFVGANMSVAQINSFWTNKGIYTSPADTYHDVVRDFTDFSGMGMVMFGQMEAAGSPIIEIVGEYPIENPFDTSVALERVVSKVALTYTADPGNSNHAKLHPGIDGFIDADSIYFMLNTTSKSIDFIKKATPSYRYKMSDYLEVNTNYYTLYSYKKDPTDDFMMYTPKGIVYGPSGTTYNTAEIKMPNDISPGDDNPYHKGLSEYDPSLTPNHKHYGSSLYCLENTVEYDLSLPDPDDKLEQVRQGINTRVIVAAKYVPNIIWHYNGSGNVYQVPINSHVDLQNITKDNGDTNGEYTFYAVLITPAAPSVPAEYEYYTYAAKEHILANPDPNDPKDFITYKGGYGYYATFVTQGKDATEDENYNLERNTYYILNVEQFVPPGAVYPQQVYMLVNSETTEWVTKKEIIVPLD